jgi:arabinofuranosyltransferase
MAVRTRVTPRLWVLACAAAFLALCAVLRAFITDDAYITVRYAENLASGAGFTWNPGGPRVEGFSNPLLVSIEASGRLAGLPAIDVARALGVAAGIALLGVIHVAGPPVAGRTATRAALLLVAAYPPLALWAVGGLETVPTALAITAGVLALARERPRRRDAVRAGAAFAALPWLRPEGVAIALAVAVAAEAAAIVRGPDRRAAAARLALAAGPPLISQLLLEALRLSVYGHLLPNSAIYKRGTGGTFDVLALFIWQAWPLLVAAVVGAIVARRRQRLLAVPALVYAAGSIGTLDSVDFFGRFFLPAWPQLALLAGIAAAAAPWRALRVALPAALAAAGLLFGTATLAHAHRFGDSYVNCREAVRAAAADWLRTSTPPGTVFSISDAGIAPARAGRTAIDQFMLNDPLIQRTGPLHVPRRVAVVYSRHPDVLMLASRDPRHFRAAYPTDGAIARDGRFAGYRLAHVSARPGCNYSLFAYARR